MSVTDYGLYAKQQQTGKIIFRLSFTRNGMLSDVKLNVEFAVY